MPPPQQRDRYYASSRPTRHDEQQSRHAQPSHSRYGAKKEETRYAGKKVSRHDAAPTAAAASSSAAPSNAREVALRDALAKALSHPDAAAGASSAHAEVDSYGNGSPTDRLQFGYSPAVAAEAVAFHARFSSADWVAARRRNGRLVFAKKQKLNPVNCEPVTSIMKLQRHWKSLNAFQSDVRGGKSTLKSADLDQLLDMLASKQRIGEDE